MDKIQFGCSAVCIGYNSGYVLTQVLNKKYAPPLPPETQIINNDNLQDESPVAVESPASTDNTALTSQPSPEQPGRSA